jgi:hypothetical protein
MEPVREAWTDERLDDLNHRVELGFRELREDINRRFDAVESRLDGMDAGQGRTDARLDGIQRAMMQMTAAMTAAILAGFGAITALIATQL